jgi:endoglucanase
MNFNLARVFKKPGHYAATNNQINQRKIRMKIQLKHGYNWDIIPERQRINRRAMAPLFALACLLLLPLGAFAQAGFPLPTPTYGWNMGNTMEPPCGEGCWGGVASQNLINAAANAGFNAVRIPVAWDSHANQQTYQIDPNWLARVKQVVDWCYARNLPVVINCHWDNGWLENNIDGTVNSTIDAKMQAYWTQIATTFANYDSKLLFAGANEPNADTAAEMAELLHYYQTFVNAVRAVGGQNTTRWLVLSGPNTSTTLTYDLFNTLPNDPTPGRLAIEVHEYSPYNFTLMAADESWGNMFYFWGLGYHHPTRLDRNPTWGEEDYLLSEHQKMKTKFVDQGIPVILGEFTAMRRSGYPDLTGSDYNLHLASRTYWHHAVQNIANDHGLKPFFWDVPGVSFDWASGAETDPDNINGLTGGNPLPPPTLCTPSQTSVAALVTVVTGNGKNKRGKATITVTDNCGNPVANATVTGNFTGTFNESGRTGVTGANGVATITTNGKTGGNPSVTFCVSNITKSGLAYTPSANVLTCDNN